MTNINFNALMYHGIHDSPQCEGNFDAVYSVSQQTFCQHLDWIMANGFQAVTLQQALSGKYSKPIVITFDDGDISNYHFAFPELQKRGMLAEFYITTDWINTSGYMSESQLIEMHQAGMSIQSHGKSHAYLSDVAIDELREELSTSFQRLKSITQANIHTIALPGGRGLKQVLPIYQEIGYQHIATSILGDNGKAQYFNRVTITAHCDLATLSALVTRKGWIYTKAIVKQNTFNFAKFILGNQFYDVVRSKLLRES